MTALKYAKPWMLIQGIADGLRAIEDQRSDAKVGCLEVAFVTPEVEEYIQGTVAQALDAVANDLTWDERGSWADASLVLVRTI